MVYASTSSNKRYAFRRTVRAAPGSEKPQSGYALCAVLSSPHLGQGTFASQSPITCPKRRIPTTLSASFSNLNIDKKVIVL